jgi:hypothetical protein
VNDVNLIHRPRLHLAVISVFAPYVIWNVIPSAFPAFAAFVVDPACLITSWLDFALHDGTQRDKLAAFETPSVGDAVTTSPSDKNITAVLQRLLFLNYRLTLKEVFELARKLHGIRERPSSIPFPLPITSLSVTTSKRKKIHCS